MYVIYPVALTTALPDPNGAGSLAAETLTTTYNARGLAETVLGIDTYVSDFDYEANGALDRQTGALQRR